MSQPTETNPRNRFDALEVALEIAGEVRRLVEAIGTRDPDLVRQLRRAGPSIPMNAAEGNRRTGKDRPYHFNVAAGSAGEVAAAARVAIAMGYVEPSRCARLLALCDRELAMLWRLTHPR